MSTRPHPHEEIKINELVVEGGRTCADEDEAWSTSTSPTADGSSSYSPSRASASSDTDDLLTWERKNGNGNNRKDPRRKAITQSRQGGCRK